MKNKSHLGWIDELVNYVGLYTRLGKGCSTLELADIIGKKYSLSPEDAKRLASVVEKELNLNKIGLAAIELNLTFNCNLNCEYCFIRQKSPRDRMNITTAQKAVDLLIERAVYPVVNITLIGGEPLLEYKLIKQIVPYAEEAAARRNITVSWSVTTNGTLINERILDFFARHKINMLLSIDGGPETHDRYRKTRSGKGTWHKIVGLIPLIKSYQPWLGVRMTVSTEAVGSMREDFNKLVGIGVNQFIIAPAQGPVCWSKDQLHQYGINIVKVLQDYIRYRQSGTPIFIEEFENDENDQRVWGCRAGKTSLAIAPNGDVSPCSKMLGLTSEKGRHIVGNINAGIDVKLLEPFQNPIASQPENCKKCPAKCTGGCYAVNYEQTGSHFLSTEENCLFSVIFREARKLNRYLGSIKMVK